LIWQRHVGLTAAGAVPEPAGAALGALALSCVGVCRRRQRGWRSSGRVPLQKASRDTVCPCHPEVRRGVRPDSSGDLGMT
jgi:hypothetical protein